MKAKLITFVRGLRNGTMPRFQSYFKSILMVVALLSLSSNVWGATAPVNTVLWGENFAHFGTKTPSSAGTGTGTTIYDNASITYGQDDTGTKGYNETYAGGTAPELLLKSGKKWTISGIKTGGAKTLSLEYLSNNTKSSVSCSTSGVSVSGSSKAYTIKSSTPGAALPETIILVFNCSGNTRLDNIVLKVTEAGSSYTVTPQANNSSWGSVSVSGTTITATPNSGYRVMSGDDGYEVKAGTATVTNNGDNTFTVTPSANCTVQINFESKGCTDHSGTNVTSGASTSYEYGPVSNYYNYSTRQILYTKTDLGLAAGKKGTIKSIYFEYAYSTAMKEKNNVTIYMANTNLTALSTSAYVPFASFTEVYSGALNCSNGWNEIVLTTPFVYNGSGSLVVLIDDNSGDYDGSSSTYLFKYHTASTTTGAQIYTNSDSKNEDPSTTVWSSYTAKNYRPNTKFCLEEADMTKETVNWYVNGSLTHSQNDYSGTTCTAPTTPTSSDCDGSKVFVGWTATQDYEHATTAPFDLFTDPTTKTIPDGGTNYYAVFADASNGATTNYAKITSMDALTDNNYVFAYDYNGGTQIAMKNTSSEANKLDGSALTLSAQKYANPDAAHIWQIKKVIDGNNTYFTIYNAAISKYVRANSTGVSLVDNAFNYSVSWDDSNNCFRFQSSTAQTYYLCGYVNGSTYYFQSSTSGNGARYHVHLYKNEDGTTYSNYTTSCGPFTYTVDFVCNGATSGCPSQMDEQTNLPDPLPDAPTNPGYSFDGWYTNEGLTTPATAGAALTENTTLYAKWEKKKPTQITLTSSNGFDLFVGDGTTIRVSAWEPADLLDEQKEITYSFKDDMSGKATINATTGVVTTIGVCENCTIYGTSTVDGNIKGEYVIHIHAPNYFANNKTIFIMGGSYGNAWADNACVKAWYSNNGGGGAAPTPTWIYDNTYKIFALVMPEIGDYNQIQLQRFASNCSDKHNDNGTVYKSGQGDKNVIISNNSGNDAVAWHNDILHIYLRGSLGTDWNENLGELTDQGAGIFQYTYTNYESNGTEPEFKWADNFGGWKSGDNVKVTDMVNGSTYNLIATLDVTQNGGAFTVSKELVACKVHFDMQGHGSTIASLTGVTPNSKIAEPTAPTEENYRFDGWYKEAGCTNAWNFATDEVQETMTLFAKWTRVYTYTFSGEGACANGVAGAGEVVNLCADPVITGKSFTGWTVSGGVVVSGSANNYYFTMPSNNVTITAGLSWKTTAITLSKNGGTNNGSAAVTYGNATLTSITHVTYSTTTKQLIGYAVSGSPLLIVINANGELQPNIDGYTNANHEWIYENAEVSLVAQYNTGNTVTFSAPSGNTQRFVITDQALGELPPDPGSCDTENGYTTFIGWSTAQNGTADAPSATLQGDLVTATTVPADNATYHAVWADGGGGDNTDYSSTYTTGINVTVNGATGCTVDGDDGQKAGTGKAGGSVNVTIPANTTKVYFHMVGWSGENNKTISVSADDINVSLSPSEFTTIADEGVAGNGTAYTLSGTKTNYSYLLTTSNVTSETVLTFANGGAKERFVIWGVNVNYGTPPTGYISTCCASAAVVTVTPTSSALALNIDGQATTTVHFEQTGAGSGRYYAPTITPAEGASLDWAGSYKEIPYNLTFTATQAGSYEVKGNFTETAAACAKYGSATITVAANPLLIASTDALTVNGICESEGTPSEVTINSRYLTSANLTAIAATTAGSGAYKVSKDGTNYSTEVQFNGGTSDKGTQTLYIRYDGATDEAGVIAGTVTISGGGANQVINLSGNCTCGTYVKLTPTDANSVRILAPNGQWTQTMTPIAISAKYLSQANGGNGVKIKLSSNNEKFKFTTGGTSGQVEFNSEKVTADTYNQNIYLVYTPTSNNANEQATITAEVITWSGTTVHASADVTAYGRSLPETFVLALNTGSQWVAVPADMIPPYGGGQGECATGVGTHDPYPITVDNSANPTVASDVPARAIYKGAGRNTSTTQPWTVQFESNSQADFMLWGSQNATTIANQAMATSEHIKWNMFTNDLVTFQMKLSDELNTRKLGYNGTSGQNNIGQYSNNASAYKYDFRILPITGDPCDYYVNPVMTVENYTATTTTISIPYDGMTNYMYSDDNKANWTAITGTIDCKKLFFEFANSTFKGKDIWMKANAVVCQGDATSETAVHIPNPSFNNPGAQAFEGAVNAAFNGEFAVTGTDIQGAVTVESSNSNIHANYNAGTVTVTMAATATPGVYSTSLTFSTEGATDLVVAVTITIHDNIILTATTNATDDVLCGGDATCTFGQAFYTSVSDATAQTNKLSTSTTLEGAIFMRDVTDGTETAINSAHINFYTAGIPTADYREMQMTSGHTYQFVYYNNLANGGAGCFGHQNGQGLAFTSCESEPFIYVAQCNKPNILQPCVTATTADINWLYPNCHSGDVTVDVYTKSEAVVYSADFTSGSSIGISSKDKGGATTWTTAQNAGVNTKDANGYPLSWKSSTPTGCLYSPTFTNLYKDYTPTVPPINYSSIITVEIVTVNNHSSTRSLSFRLVDGYANSGSTRTGISCTIDGKTANKKDLTLSGNSTETWIITFSGVTASNMMHFVSGASSSSAFLKSVRILDVSQDNVASVTEDCSTGTKQITGLEADTKYYYTITKDAASSGEGSFTTWKSGSQPSLTMEPTATTIHTTSGVLGTEIIHVTGTKLTSEPILSGLTAPFRIVNNNLRYNCETGELSGDIEVGFNGTETASQTLTISTSGHNYTNIITGQVCPELTSGISHVVNDDEVSITLGSTPYTGAVYLTDLGNPNQNVLASYNPSFESGGTYWKQPGQHAGLTYEVSTSVHHEGSQSVLIEEYENKGNLSRNGDKYTLFYNEGRQMQKGSYTLTAWVRGVCNDTKVNGFIGATTGTGTVTLGMSNVTSIQGTNWVQLNCTFTLDNTKEVQVYFAKDNAKNYGTHRVYLDEVVLTASTQSEAQEYTFKNATNTTISGLYPNHNYSYTVKNAEGCEYGPFDFSTGNFEAPGRINIIPSPTLTLNTTKGKSVKGMVTVNTEYIKAITSVSITGTDETHFSTTPSTVSLAATGGSFSVTFDGNGNAGSTYTATLTVSGTDINDGPVSEFITLRGVIAAGSDWDGKTIEVVDIDPTHLTIEHNIEDGTGVQIIFNRELEGDEIVKNEGCELFFSKYYEAYQNVKLWAIYNPTKEAIDLTDLYVIEAHAGKSDKGTIGWSSTSYCELKGLGKSDDANKIAPNEEIIVYCPGNSNADNQTIACAASKADMSNWNSKDGSTNAAAFNGNDALALVRGSGNARYSKTDYEVYDNGELKPITLNWREVDWNEKTYEMLDLIGARTNGNLADNSACKTPSFDKYNEERTAVSEHIGNGDDLGWVGIGHDMEGNYATISTNRCLLVRLKSVKHGWDAVNNNVGDMLTLTNEWQGAYVPVENDIATSVTTSCENFSFVGDFNYSDYYNRYTEIDPEAYEFAEQNPDGSYTAEFASLDEYTCQNILIEVTKTSEVGGVEVKQTKASVEYKVPIIVNVNMTTADEKFTRQDDCDECDVVVLSNQTLSSTTASGAENELHNITVYPGGNLLVAGGADVRVNDLRIQSKNDVVAYGMVNGTLTVSGNLVHIKSIDSKAWYPFSLPYDCSIDQIRQLNGKTLGDYGTDWVIRYYNGARRAEVGTKDNPNRNFWKNMTADGTLKANQGYIIALGGKNESEAPAGERFKTIYFAPKDKQATYSETGEDARSYTINGYTGTATEEPNNQLYDKGWNFVACPYVSRYQLANSGLDDKSNLIMGYVTATGEYAETSNVFVYIPDDATKETYHIYKATDAEAKLMPFRGYFVQALATSGNTNTLTFHKDGRSLNAVVSRFAGVSDKSEVKIVATGENGKYDHTAILLGSAYTRNYDEMFDCMKAYNSNDIMPQIYTYSKDGENMMMAYNALPIEDAEDIRLGIFMPKVGAYTLHIDEENSRLTNVTNVLLKCNGDVVADLMDGDYMIENGKAMQNITDSYTISIHRMPSVTTDIQNTWRGDKPVIYSENNILRISNLPDNANVSLYDVLGHRLATSQSVDGVVNFEAPMTGVYNIVVESAAEHVTIKTVIK